MCCAFICTYKKTAKGNTEGQQGYYNAHMGIFLKDNTHFWQAQYY
jgi:hypothetical protein